MTTTMTGATRGRRFAVRRIYDEDPDDDAYRVLVDRLWPRGFTKARAAIDEWAKELAPSSDLRRWFGHDPARFDEFARRYRKELRESGALDVLHRLQGTASTRLVALVTATKDVEHSGAVVLLEVLSKKV
jgi:uncharacterized protein YeaO (DUF488 family)